MLHTNNGDVKIEQPITTEDLSIFGMPAGASNKIVSNKNPDNFAGVFIYKKCES